MDLLSLYRVYYGYVSNDPKMKPKSKLLTIKIQPDLLETFTDFADSRNMKRGTMIKSVVSDFIAKQKQQAA